MLTTLSSCVCRQESECLGKVLSRLAPFLKLYSQYTSKFHSAMESMTAWAKKERRFDAALKQFEVRSSVHLPTVHCCVCGLLVSH